MQSIVVFKMHRSNFLYLIFWSFSFCSIPTCASPVQPRNSTKQWNFPEIPSSKDLTWYPCYTNFFCAVLDVPLDYLKPDQARSYIPIIKYPATTTPYKGMILANPGGPGKSGTVWLSQTAERAAEILGLNYDLVSWDPRGIGYALPAANCSLPSNLTTPTSKRRGLDKLSGPEFPVQYFEDAYEVGFQLGQACGNFIGGSKDAGSHMATATVAKDMISVVDAYARTADGQKSEGNASLVNYWGFSYGTFLGQTFASLYPDRVGRYILDGVVDPDDWISGNGVTEITLTDDVFSTFFLYCNLAGPGPGPSSCPFYTGTTAHDISLRFEAIIDKLNATNALQQKWANASAIEIVLQGVKQQTLSWLYNPKADFPSIADFLVSVESLLLNLTVANIEAATKKFHINLNGSLAVDDLWRFAVMCADRGGKDYGRTLQSFTADIRELEAASWLGGETHAADLFICAGWDTRADDRFTGPFGGKTKNPILFVSNTLDHVTPITNARKGTRLFADSQLLTIEGAGHTSSATENNCAWAKIGAFFQNGILPGKDNYCALEEGPFQVVINGTLEKRSGILEIGEKIRGLGKL